MQDREPTARARELGLIIERAATEGGITGKILAEWLGWSPSKVSRIYSGRRPPTVLEATMMAAVCEVKGKDREYVLRLAKSVHEPSWLQEYGDRLPIELRTLIDYEEVASEITDFETTLVPGLLQIPDYTRAVLRSAVSIPADEVDDRVAARMQRQHTLSRSHRLVCQFFIDELALRRTGPGPEVMREQLRHLLMMSMQPSVIIRVIQDSIGFHPGRKPFRLMEFPELKPVVHLENETGVQFLQSAQTVACYQQIVESLSLLAWDEGQSRDWMASLVHTLGAREEHDDLAEEHVL
jgi:hypothetical protein